MESILKSIKKLLDIGEEDKSFDDDVIMHINTVIMVLNQLGVGVSPDFMIEGYEETWTDFLSDKYVKKWKAVKTYVYQKVKIVFDPPPSASHLQALKESIAEYEWRLNLEAESLSSNEEV